MTTTTRKPVKRKYTAAVRREGLLLAAQGDEEIVRRAMALRGRDEQARRRAVEELVAAGLPAAPVMIATVQLDYDDPGVVRAACEVLGRLEPQIREVNIFLVLVYSRHPDRGVQQAAWNALWRLAPDADPAGQRGPRETRPAMAT